MRLKSGTTDQYIYLVAVDATDFTTRETGLSAKMTVYRSRDGGAAAAYTTPTINETDSTNMPGVYELLVDEDTTLAAGNDSEEYVLHVKDTGGHMAPVTRVIELYRTNVTAIDGDTGPADNLNTWLTATTVPNVNVTKIDSDTGLVASQIADAVWDEVLTGVSHNVVSSAGRRLRTLQSGGNYELGLVWVDTGAGTAGTTVDENGVVTNPVNSLADALTVAASAGLSGFHFTTGDNITLTSAFNNYVVKGDNYTLSLNGQDISGSIFEKFGPVSDSGIVSGLPPVFNQGPFGVVWMGPCIVIESGFTNSDTGFQARSAGNFFFFDCHSQVAGESAPTFDFSGTGAATTAQFRRWSGGINITVDVNCTVSIDVVSGGTVTVNGTGGTVSIRGMVNVIDNSGGTVTITQTQALNRQSIAGAVWDEADTGHGDTGTFGRIRSQISQIKTKTDSLTYTVAGYVDSNIQYVNDVAITGTGDTGTADHWRPAV